MAREKKVKVVAAHDFNETYKGVDYAAVAGEEVSLPESLVIQLRAVVMPVPAKRKAPRKPQRTTRTVKGTETAVKE